MTPRQYISNPLGKGSAIASQKVREELDKEFNTLQHEMKLTRYVIEGYRLIYHVMIPSRSLKTLWYDVILEFDLEQDPAATSIMDLNFLVFSNCPSFGYTYAYTFYRQHMIPKWLQRKYPSKILNHPPVMRNQYQIIFYERSLYLALRFITRRTTVGIEDSKASALLLENTQSIAKTVQSFDSVMDKYERTKKPKEKEDDKKKQFPKKKAQPPITSRPSITSVKKVKNDTVRKAKSTTVKKVKKI